MTHTRVDAKTDGNPSKVHNLVSGIVLVLISGFHGALQFHISTGQSQVMGTQDLYIVFATTCEYNYFKVIIVKY